jgi:hypothetical protein
MIQQWLNEGVRGQELTQRLERLLKQQHGGGGPQKPGAGPQQPGGGGKFGPPPSKPQFDGQPDGPKRPHDGPMKGEGKQAGPQKGDGGGDGKFGGPQKGDGGDAKKGGGEVVVPGEEPKDEPKTDEAPPPEEDDEDKSQEIVIHLLVNRTGGGSLDFKVLRKNIKNIEYFRCCRVCYVRCFFVAYILG